MRLDVNVTVARKPARFITKYYLAASGMVGNEVEVASGEKRFAQYIFTVVNNREI